MLAQCPNRLDLDCGIAYTRIASWLDGELDLTQEDGHWVFDDNGKMCLISLEPLEKRAFPHVSIERTHLVAEGDAGALAAFEKLFTLRFISAGG